MNRYNDINYLCIFLMAYGLSPEDDSLLGKGCARKHALIASIRLFFFVLGDLIIYYFTGIKVDILKC